MTNVTSEMITTTNSDHNCDDGALDPYSVLFISVLYHYTYI